MALGFNGVTINKLVNDILCVISSLPDKELFLDKLHKVGFSFSEVYDQFVYEIKNVSKYKVDDSFPRLVKNKIHHAIAKATYEITLSDIINNKI